MKRSRIIILVIIATIVAGAGIFYGCKKEVQNEVLSTEQTVQKPTTKKVKITISWDEWGRAKKDCGGAGLCNFEITIEITSNKNHTATLESDEDYGDDDAIVNMYANILIDADYVFDEEGTYLYIDRELSNYDRMGYKYIIPQGEYPFNPDLGKFGGYTIPVTRVIIE